MSSAGTRSPTARPASRRLRQEHENEMASRLAGHDSGLRPVERLPRDDAVTLTDGEDLVGCDASEDLGRSRGPANLQPFDDRGLVEADVDARVALRQIARAGLHLAHQRS